MVDFPLPICPAKLSILVFCACITNCYPTPPVTFGDLDAWNSADVCHSHESRKASFFSLLPKRRVLHAKSRGKRLFYEVQGIGLQTVRPYLANPTHPTYRPAGSLQ
jgi:hypothetical protein